MFSVCAPVCMFRQNSPDDIESLDNHNDDIVECLFVHRGFYNKKITTELHALLVFPETESN